MWLTILCLWEVDSAINGFIGDQIGFASPFLFFWAIQTRKKRLSRASNPQNERRITLSIIVYTFVRLSGFYSFYLVLNAQVEDGYNSLCLHADEIILQPC